MEIFVLSRRLLKKILHVSYFTFQRTEKKMISSYKLSIYK